MAGELAGKTITITTTKSTTPEELSEAFGATTHPRCASGAVVTAREAVVQTDPAGTIAIG
jgi:hypothetical protein